MAGIVNSPKKLHRDCDQSVSAIKLLKSALSHSQIFRKAI